MWLFMDPVTPLQSDGEVGKKNTKKCRIFTFLPTKVSELAPIFFRGAKG